MSRHALFEASSHAARYSGGRMQGEPPLDPDRQEARRWAAEELSKPVYRDAQPDWLTDLWRQFTDWLRSLNSGDPDFDTSFAVPVIGVTIVVLIAAAVLFARPRLNARRRPARDRVDADPSVSPAEYRRLAAAAAARSDWRAAVVEQFRAIVRSAEDRTIIDPLPGRTADEVAGQLAGTFGSHADALQRAAVLFDGIRYGRAQASARDHSDLVALDEVLAAAKPDFGRSAPDRFAVPQ